MTLTFLSIAAFAQQTTGNVRGLIKDPTGAVVASAKVTILDKQTNTSLTTESTGAGEYEFRNLLTGDYQITVEAQGFKKATLTGVRVQLNQTTDIGVTLEVGAQNEVLEVSAGGAELVDTTTTNLSKGFTSRQVIELAQTATGAGIYNLALIAPNVSSSGGVGVGMGGSVGGQRPRNNNFVVDGIDNNDKAVTGPQVYISPDSVAEFSLLQNQFSSEFARSTRPVHYHHKERNQRLPRLGLLQFPQSPPECARQSRHIERHQALLHGRRPDMHAAQRLCARRL
jgi:hypothetical protein